ncbi:aldo/keto reductase [Aquibacillus koreensis]|uniref:Aldo/keto reductase n=1 Tax=Aquibacillus koreensis TaxID=279446 RepID=A0A9X3WH52_9BACI|nr:aldo/keto reductase [Aquibacillus koreensis]MCT2537457.1 aldo/keto reductase [Aquibacillus koreensis]MDC3418903.1 aldo/keto reductase [Aquibacillus koreensis]
MKKNRLGYSDLYVSEVALGCMSLGTDEQKAKKIIDQALDAGINYLDTADLYDQGVNESIVGGALKGRRDKVVLATKVGNHLKDDGSWFWDPSKSYIKNQVKESLRRLNTDYIDLYQLHGGTIKDPIDETIEAFEELKQDGIIRYYGISSIRPNVIREYIYRSSIVSVMMQYSLLDRRPEEEILDLLAENQISVVARGPVAKGMLSKQAINKVEEKGKDGYLDYTYSELKHIAEGLSNKAKDKNQSINSLALQYILHHEAVSSAVVGASSVTQLQENMQAMNEKELSADDYGELQALTKANQYDKHR